MSDITAPFGGITIDFGAAGDAAPLAAVPLATAPGAGADGPLETNVLILGSGPAGLTAAIYAARANLAPIVLAGYQPGGQLTITSEVENYPGFPEGIQGPELMARFRQQAERFGTRVIDVEVERVDFSSRPFRAWAAGVEYRAQAVIVATGASALWLGLDSEERLRGHGVSACATCDGFFYKNKDVVVIGGGNTAVEEALFLTNFASKVTVVHRRDSFRAERILQDRLKKNPKISVIWDTELQDVHGDHEPLKVRSVTLRNVKTGALTQKDVDGVFVAIGHSPSTELVVGQLKLKPSGYVETAPNSTATSIPGVYAAGDVTDDIFRQAVTAAGMGCMAALEAEKFLAAHGEAESAVAAE